MGGKKKKKKTLEGPKNLSSRSGNTPVGRACRSCAFFFYLFSLPTRKNFFFFFFFFFFLIYFIFRDPAHLNLSSTGTCRQHVIQTNDIRSEVRARTKLLLLRFIFPRLFHRPMKDWASAAPKRRAEPKAIEKS